MNAEIHQYLTALENAMKEHNVWEAAAPSAEALESTEPFSVNTLSPTQWLQWIFIPRMKALLEAGSELPRNFTVTHYLEESLKDEKYLAALHSPLAKLEQLLKDA
ncbi:anhydro-N-acetylmuramic acid kinase [Vespertiliibacter pulmonis]|uniref:Uncharacterized protein YqcC (DUF446 family) n=1 Tax=Vespertiliibacter pulmonis TaxID=1443036 RepID=A0A3N4VST3_9PAST|nr:YqcC family protein [Vespertiliibacter pulmonis]QLB20197.1 anhydro-N-acetylmuramic acid kinase [Vespertiliibacter pulmonis]RPE86172.1 uncharacterized protein YqcC (DUF446 family) [Vespertiliibacter pulmonis]